MPIHWGEFQRQIRLKQMKFGLSVRGTGTQRISSRLCQRVALTHCRYDSHGTWQDQIKSHKNSLVSHSAATGQTQENIVKGPIF